MTDTKKAEARKRRVEAHLKKLSPKTRKRVEAKLKASGESDGGAKGAAKSDPKLGGKAT